MNLLFDLIPTQPFGSSTYHGGAEYAKALFERVVRGKEGAHVSAIVDGRRPVDPAVLDLAESSCVSVHRVRDAQEAASLARDGGASVFYTALPLKYRDERLGKTAFAFTIHDLRTIELPTDETEWRYGGGMRHRLACLSALRMRERLSRLNKERLRSLFGVSKRFRTIAVSRHTRFSLLAEFPELDPESVELLYPPPIPVSVEDDTILSELSLGDDEYFLVLGADRWKKNAYRALLAFRELIGRFPGIDRKLLVLGANPDLPYLPRAGTKGKIVCAGYVPRPRLESLYRHCFCLVFPSLNEGFGYPPLECMKYGKPVIASVAGAIPEVLEGAAAYFDPRSIREMTNRMLQVCLDDGYRRELGSRGKRRSEEMAAAQGKALDRLADIVLGRA
jgi:glycosyltransferase involved in cell wall biosynthesis